MRIRRTLALAGFAVLGAAVVVLPAEAGSETGPPAVVAENIGEYSHRWQPAEAAVDPGGTVDFANATEVPHGIRWVSGPGTPECAAGVPVGTASGTKWSGSCTFAAAGTYRFYCTVHGAAMSGVVTVGTPASTEPPATGTSVTTTPGVYTTGPSTAPAGPTVPSAPGAPSALRLLASHRGTAVRVSLQIPPSGAGGTVSVVLRAPVGARRHQLVGHIVRAYLSAGNQAWSVPLSAPARRSLRRRGRLAVSAEVTFTAPGGTPVSLSRTLNLRR